MLKKKRCPKGHLAMTFDDNVYWWCNKCQKDYKLTELELELVKHGEVRGRIELRRKIKMLLGIV